MKKLSLGILLLIVLQLNCISKSIESPDLRFNLIIKESDSDPNYMFGNWGVNMAVDNEGYIYLLDGQGGFVRKYDINGKYILKFGRKGTGPGEFPSFSEFISCPDGNLISFSLINGVANIFSKTGSLIKSYRKEGRLFSPIFLKDGSILYYERKWVNNGKNDNSYFSYTLILDDKKELHTLKSFPDGKYRKALANINSRVFQDNWTYCEDFIYAADSRNNIYYALSDNYKIWRCRGGKSELLISENRTPIPFNDKAIIDNIKNEEKMRSKTVGAKYVITVPKYWQLIYEITADEKDNIWVYVKSRERHGLIKYSRDGVFQKYYQVNLFSKEVRVPRSNFQLFVWKNNIYVSRYDTENGVEIYSTKIRE